MKAIILAAGMGTRLSRYAKNLPKCMLVINGKTLIEWQIAALKSVGINSITVVKGYMSEKIVLPELTYYYNKEYVYTNMVETLMCAEAEMDDDILICYGDILYQRDVLQKIVASKVDIGVTIDVDYLDYWQARSKKWQDDIESVVIGDDDTVVEIGTPNCPLEKARVRYVGLIKFSKEGLKTLKKTYHENKEKYFDSDEPFLHSKSFKRMYMTDMIQLLINSGHSVSSIPISRGWLEFDTDDDYEKAHDWIANGVMKRFFEFGY